LGQFDEGLREVTPFVGDLELAGDFLDGSLGFGDLDEGGSSIHETIEEAHAFVYGVDGEVGFDAVCLVGGLSVVALASGNFHLVLGHGDESFIGGDEFLESSSLWVEGVLEMGRSDTESDLGISESDIDFLVELMMLGGGPSVLLFLRTELEVKVPDEVLEGGDQFIHWAFSLNL